MSWWNMLNFKWWLARDELVLALEQAVWARRSARARMAYTLGYRLEDVENALLLLRHGCASGIEVHDEVQTDVLKAWQAVSIRAEDMAENLAEDVSVADRDILMAALRRLQKVHPADPLFIEDALTVLATAQKREKPKNDAAKENVKLQIQPRFLYNMDEIEEIDSVFGLERGSVKNKIEEFLREKNRPIGNFVSLSDQEINIIAERLGVNPADLEAAMLEARGKKLV